MRSFREINEAAYVGNMGFAEMVAFYQKASPADQVKMDAAVKKDDFKLFKKLIQKVLGVALK